MKNLIIQRIMTENPQYIMDDDSVEVAAKIFKDKKVHHLPVVQADKLVGVVTPMDLLINLSFATTPDAIQTTLIKKVMTPNPTTIQLNAHLREAAMILFTKNIHSLPVVDHTYKLMGIITSTDLIKHLLMQIPQGDGSLKPVSVDSLKDQIRKLEDIRMATESFLRTGYNEHDHAILLKKLDAFQNKDIDI